MAHRIKSVLSHKVAEALCSLPTKFKVEPSTVVPFIKIKPSKDGTFEYTFDIEVFRRSVSIPDHTVSRESKNLYLNELIETCKTSDSIDDIFHRNNQISFKVNPQDATNEVVNSVVNDRMSWKRSPLFTSITPLNIVVEYSSPNIAKPFHVGHLRSTLIGNVIANVSESVGHNVKRLNYLGDWGTQFGLLKYAFDMSGTTMRELAVDPIRKLYELYVWINKEAENDPTVKEKAREIFAEMETGDEEHLRLWKMFRDYSIMDLEKSYKDLNIVFDKYDGESMYNIEKCNRVLDLLQEMGKLEESDGRRVYSMPSYKATLLKSDGSTLYLTRDLAAALERFERYKFDRMYYVVETGQHDHFKALKAILNDLNPVVAERIKHVMFGRISGMSTRKGNCIFLSDLLEEAKERKIQDQKDNMNTKVDGVVESHDTAGIIARTAITYYILRIKKNMNFDFSWQDALRPNKGGSHLQYSHCRLVNIEKNSGYSFNPEASCDLLTDPVCIDLVALISQFDEHIYSSYENHDPSIFAKYLSTLTTCINRAYIKLPVKTSSQPEAESKLKLFRAARITLSEGMKILGMQPVDIM